MSETIKLPQTHLASLAVAKSYSKGEHQIPVLRGVDFQVRRGEFVSIIGQSGSGKSTLLHLLGLLDSPDVGEVQLYGHRIDDLPAKSRDELRNRVFGFIFQFYHLLPVLTAYENVELPLLLLPLSSADRKQRVMTALELVELSSRLHHRPGQLSGGQQQRVGIARAIVTDPTLIVADEPTGDLDSRSADEILKLLATLQHELQKTIIMVTHDPKAAERASRTLHLEKGRLVVDTRAPQLR